MCGESFFQGPNVRSSINHQSQVTVTSIHEEIIPIIAMRACRFVQRAMRNQLISYCFFLISLFVLSWLTCANPRSSSQVLVQG